jgi:hypothetical protein
MSNWARKKHGIFRPNLMVFETPQGHAKGQQKMVARRSWRRNFPKPRGVFSLGSP